MFQQSFALHRRGRFHHSFTPKRSRQLLCNKLLCIKNRGRTPDIISSVAVSHGLAMVVEKAVSQWGLPNGYILVKKRAVPLSAASAMATARYTQEMPVLKAVSRNA